MADLKRWSQDEITRMRREMDRLFDDLCMDFDLPVMFCRIAGDLDLKEDGDALIVRFELGNMNPDDVKVTVHDRRLVITAQSVQKGERSLSSHSFSKEVRLPCIIRPQDVNAEFEDGVLIVRLPKCPTQQGQSIEIKKK